MKKLILLLSVFALVFTSCKNDDDTTASSQDQIVGTWKFYKYFVNDEEDVNFPCDTEATFVFGADGTFTFIDYIEDASNNCIVDENISGTWTQDGNNNYTMTDGVETLMERVVFESNKFYFEYIDENGTPGDTSDDIVEKDVYIRQ